MSDVVIVGAGIVGLAHAVEAVARGLTVTVLERDERAVGASVRNFGHGCLTAQTGDALRHAERGRDTWLRLGRAAGFGVAECGTVVVARSAEERAALEELAATRGADVELLDPREVAARVPVAAADLHGGAFLPRDLRVDQRAAVGAIAAWLNARPGAEVRFGAPVLGIGEAARPGGDTEATHSPGGRPATDRARWRTGHPGADGSRGAEATGPAATGPGVTGTAADGPVTVHTGRGDVRARQVLVCVGHDVDRLFPDLADTAGVRRCVLQMLQVRPSTPVTIGPAVLTGSSMLRYPALAGTAGAAALRERWRDERPALLDAGINHMLTQLPGGDLVVGDTHTYDRTPGPWSDEQLDDLLLAETRALLGTDIAVVRRWQGVYADAPGEFLIRPAAPATTAVSVTSGIGMTTAFGLAPAVLDRLCAATPTTQEH
ncbi:FAD dependent oxidoreductase TIGR03364 [Pseudonocardia ammonioxydans]|uniref:FAD dependent oxidoreductase TIGR03364 n=1 Tax=Pseudonocardia ammonioxydans TaxID=260086 RepID=A0A1I5DJ31_PSUAM|nr:FAD-dependent oxidoreductase [Pseudonocardia ammonioxydans]SFN99156.1 FAD dependent oxidoreductase TIGR03364 [Pseudonocardia ammonioxydans]